MKIQKNKSLKELTTFKIGGIAKYYVCIKHYDELKEALKFAKKNNLKVFILGKGSNILFDSKGFFGIVIHINLDFLKKVKNHLIVGAGYSFPLLGYITAKNNFSGLEFAKGVPGSLGGAIYMNASAFNQSVSDSLLSVQYLDENENVITLKKENCDFEYRNSIFQKNKGIILSARFLLKENKNALNIQKEIMEKKLANQPLNERNAGCIFKNPKNNSARKVIENCSLIDFKIGGAKVSLKHANFIINEKDATSEDVLDLIKYIKKIVFEKTNIQLKEEVKYIPY